MAASIKLTIASHHFKVEPRSESAKAVCFEFTRKFLKVDFQGNIRTITTFAAANKERTWFRFHINSLEEFYMFARNRNYPKDSLEIETLPYYEPKKVDLPIKSHWTVRETQVPIVEYLTKPVGVTDPKAKLVGIATGEGKTFCAIKSISDLGCKVATIIKPKYIQKWVDDYADSKKGVLDIKKSEIMTIQGGAELQKLTQLALMPGALDEYKIFIFSNRSYDNYIKTFEQIGVTGAAAMGYMVPPEKLFEKLGVGVRLIDEVHEEFHANFRLDLYSHVPLSISLSATLINRDPMMMRMYETAYPAVTRYAAPPPKKYTTSYGVYYQTNPHYKLKTSERGQSSYSHNAYESSILKNQVFTHNYCKMVKHYLDLGYVKHHEPGHKAIIFASTIDMCTKLTQQLSQWYPQYTVKRFVAGDNYQSNYQDPDIRVTTIGSGGTGHDIKNLTDGHMTNAIDSIQANIQAFGRLRELTPKETRFFFYSNNGIKKHKDYHHKKEPLMRQRAKSYSMINYDPVL